ncbi:MAG: LysR family transcriptional regulator [Firmicutes bacterium]|nr:LysR family transcriptional regulator [Bacillota bacterium]
MTAAPPPCQDRGMELHQLRIFIQVIENAGFTRAAAALHLTQPAVSQQIRALEEELGLELVRRVGRTVRPTKAGEILLEHARTILAVAEGGKAALAEFRAERRGRLVLGAGNTTITFRLPPLLREYRRREPSVEVVVRAGNSNELLALLEEDRLDVALVTSPIEGRAFHTIPLFHDEIVLILPADHPLCGRTGLGPEDLLGVPSILFARGSGFRRFLDEAFARAGYRPQVVMELESVEGIKRLVQIGLGLSFLPRIAVEEELDEGSLRTLPVAGLVPAIRTTHAIHRRAQFLPAPLRAFLDLLLEVYGEGAEKPLNAQKAES